MGDTSHARIRARAQYLLARDEPTGRIAALDSKERSQLRPLSFLKPRAEQAREPNMVFDHVLLVGFLIISTQTFESPNSPTRGVGGPQGDMRPPSTRQQRYRPSNDSRAPRTVPADRNNPRNRDLSFEGETGSKPETPSTLCFLSKT